MATADQRQGRGSYQHKPPEVTTQELGTMIGKILDSLVEAVKTGYTERLTSYLKA